MSTKYTGGFITKSPVAPTTSAASGIWTLDQQQQAQKAGTWPSPPIFIEDLFSTYLWTGNGSTQTINNGIDLAGKGGLVWTKCRSTAYSNALTDTVRGAGNGVYSNTTQAQGTSDVSSFTSTGFGLTFTDNTGNRNDQTYVGWTFREQPKFFDIVTWSGDDASNRQIPHNLGSVPGCIIARATNSSNDWAVYHRSLGNTKALYLNLTQAQETNTNWGNTTPTSSVFTTNLNGAGNNYVAYLFAHDAGGFPVSGGGSTNGISCGTFTTSSSAATVNLGYEPQWILWKRTDSTGNWNIYDTMRGLAQTKVAQLSPNLSNAETMYAATSASAPAFPYLVPTSTGFQLFSAFGVTGTFIYIAIRRGPMKTPTDATTLFSPQTATYTANQVLTTNFVADLVIQSGSNAVTYRIVQDRLRGVDTNFNSSDPTSAAMFTNTDDAERGDIGYTNLYTNTNYRVSGGFSGFPSVNWNFSRAPSVFDIVCYTGTEVARTITHNLGVAPELLIVKRRDGVGNWRVYNAVSGTGFFLNLNGDEPASSSGASTYWNSTTPTASVFSLGTQSSVNGGGYTFVAYLFATCAGVSKVGGYTGTGALQTINCGFTSGARFVLIKQTDTDGVGVSGPWYVYDSARGISSGNDPYLLINNTAAQVTGTNYVDTDTTGFKVTAAAPATLNANGKSYIFLAIA